MIPLIVVFAMSWVRFVFLPLHPITGSLVRDNASPGRQWVDPPFSYYPL